MRVDFLFYRVNLRKLLGTLAIKNLPTVSTVFWLHLRALGPLLSVCVCIPVTNPYTLIHTESDVMVHSGALQV